MYRRDLITAEIENLSKVLSKITELKLDGKLLEADSLFNETMIKNFSLQSSVINDGDLSIFETWLNHSDMGAEKLDSLSEFLYYQLGVSTEKNLIIAPKLNLIYQQLADKYKIVHLTNLHRQKNIQQYL